MGDGGDSLTVSCDSVRSNAPCYIFESDFYVDPKNSGGNVIQITLGNKAYMLVMKVEGDVLKVRGSLDKKGLLGRTMDWFRVK
jgi:uncharacterized protein (DUF2147 family)